MELLEVFPCPWVTLIHLKTVHCEHCFHGVCSKSAVNVLHRFISLIRQTCNIAFFFKSLSGFISIPSTLGMEIFVVLFWDLILARRKVWWTTSTQSYSRETSWPIPILLLRFGWFFTSRSPFGRLSIIEGHDACSPAIGSPYWSIMQSNINLVYRSMPQ